MSVVTITLQGKKFDLYCQAKDQNALFGLAEKLNQEISRMRLANPSASFELLLVMIALNFQNERQISNSPSANNHQDLLKTIHDKLELTAAAIERDLTNENVDHESA